MITLKDVFSPRTIMIGPRTKVVVGKQGGECSVSFGGRLFAEFRVVGPQPDHGRFHSAVALLSPGIDVDIEKNTQWQNVKTEFSNWGLFTGPAEMYVFAKRLAASLEKNDGDWTLFLKPHTDAAEKPE